MPQIGTLNSITVPPQRGELLLDRYPIDAAFSLRRVRSDYDGPCVRVYAANNSGGERIYADIGFTPEGDLDVEALKRHCTNGGTKLGVDGFVHTWYNQSAEGGKYNAVQTATADMPKIFDATEGYLGCIENTGNRYLRSENQLTGVTDLALVYEKSADGVGNYVIGEHNAANARNGIQCMATASASASLGLSWNMSGSNTLTDVGTDTGETIDEKFAGFFYTNGSEKFGVVNGYVAGRNDSATSFDFDYIFTMATNDGSQDNFDFAGKVYEVFLSTSDLSANRIEIENDVLYNNGLPVPGTSFVRENPGAKLAISTRSLNREYVGPIVEVRGAQTTEVTEGVYLDSTGVVNEAKITALCTDDQAGDALVDGFVRTWYDQSGEGNDAVNTDDASQPKIHDATDGIIFSNGTIGVEFADSLGNLNTGYTPASGDFSFYVVGNVTPTGDGLDNIIGTVQHAQANDVGRWYFSNSSNNEQFTFGSYGQETVNISTTVGSVPINEMFLGSVSVDSEGNSSVYSSGRLEASSTGATTSHSSSLVVGRTNISRGFSGVLSEISFYEDDTASQRETIEENINKYFLIYQQAPKATSTGFLANHSNVDLAYSFRKLHSDAVKCCMVQRSSDNRAKVIGFDEDGVCDAQAIKDFVGAGDGYLVGWFNQASSDSAKHMYGPERPELGSRDSTTTVVDHAPKIVMSGVLQENFGVPCARFNGDPEAANPPPFNMLWVKEIYDIAESSSVDTQLTVHYVSQRDTDANSTLLQFDTNGAIPFTNYSIYWYNNRGIGITRDYPNRGYLETLQISARTLRAATDSLDSFVEADVIVDPSEPGIDMPYQFDGIGSYQFYPTPSGGYPYKGTVAEIVIVASEQTKEKALEQRAELDSFYNLTEKTASSGTFLNEFSGAAAAYSVRKLGDIDICMTVRKTVSSVDYYQVIGFDSNGDLDTAAIEEFGGTADVFVQTWYDQSGNGRHQVQETNAEQPKIYDGTDGIIYENGKPAVEFSAGFMTDSSANEIDILGHSSHTVFNRGATTDSREVLYGAAIDTTPYNTFAATIWDQSDNMFVLWTDANDGNSTTVLSRQILNQSTLSVLMPETDSGAPSVQLDNEDIVSSSPNIDVDNDSDFTLRLGSQGYNEYTGSIQEFVIYEDGKSGADRTNIQKNQNEYFLVHQSASASPATGLLSKAPNAHTAISTRQLGDAVLCLRARRVSDDVERNIGFVGGKLDEATLEEFSQGGDVRIVKWYDQSGNDRHYYDPSGRSHTLNGTDYTFGAVTDQSTYQMPILYEEEFGLSKFKGFPCVDGGGPNSGGPLYSSNCGDEKATMAFYVGEAKCYNDGTLFCTDRVVDVTGNLSEYHIRTSDGALAFNGSVTDSAWSYKGRPDKYSSALNNFLDDFQLAQYSLNVDNTVSGSDDSSEPLLGGRFANIVEDPPNPGVSVNPARAKYIEFITYSSGDFDEMRSIVDTDQNNYYRIYDTFKSGLLDSFPGAVAAYSLRRLSSSYDGPLIRINRLGTVVDVYPNGQGELNVGNLTNLSLADQNTTLEVITWYDQSGNGNDLTAAANLAPKIKTGEVSPTSGNRDVTYLNDRPALDFNTANNGMFTAANQQWLSGTTGRTIIAVGQADSTAVNSTIASIAYDGSPEVGEMMYLTAEAAVRVNGNATYDKDFGGAPKILFYALPESSNVGDGTIHVNGVASTATPSGTVAIDTANYSGGYSGVGNVQINASSYYYDGKMQEVIVYDSDQSENREGIERDINRYYETYTKPLLDVVPDAAAAYSLRKLRSDYTGPAINVYNGTDYKDIYFRTNGELDTKEIQRFCGSNNGFVAVWYDQSGENNHAEQTDTSLMPKIYDGTTGLVMENDKPAVEFDGSDDKLVRTSPSGFSGKSQSAFLTASTLTASSLSSLGYWALGDSSPSTGTVRSMTQEPYLRFQTSTQNYSSHHVQNAQELFSLVCPATVTTIDDYDLYKNGALLTPDSLSGGVVNDISAGALTIGTNVTENQFLSGRVQELVLYNSDQSASRTSVEENTNHYYSIY